MFDLSITELIVILAVALVVIKPEDLPGILRSFGRGLGNVKKMANEFTGILDDVSKEAELDETSKELRQIVDLEGNLRDAYAVSEIKDLVDDTRK